MILIAQDTSERLAAATAMAAARKAGRTPPLEELAILLGCGLGNEGETRPVVERTVAIVVDDEHRLRRRRTGQGYLHEKFNGVCWETAEQFGALEEVVASEVYRRFAAHRGPEGEGTAEATED